MIRLMDAVLPLDQMTVEEKLRAMEAIWRSLSKHENQVPVPDWHKQVLDERQRQIDAGERVCFLGRNEGACSKANWMTRLRRGYGEAGEDRLLPKTITNNSPKAQKSGGQSRICLPTALKKTVHPLQKRAGVHRIVYKNYHRGLATRFPFALCYSVSEQTAFVRAIVDCRRDPTWIREHLR